MGHVKITNNTGRKVGIVHKSVCVNTESQTKHFGPIEHGEEIAVNFNVDSKANNYIDFYFEDSPFFHKKHYERKNNTEKYNEERLEEFYKTEGENGKV